MEHKCKNCILFNNKNKECKISILMDGKEQNMPVDPEDFCHFEELGIEVEQVRWFEDMDGDKKVVKIEYPEDFFERKNAVHPPI